MVPQPISHRVTWNLQHGYNAASPPPQPKLTSFTCLDVSRTVPEILATPACSYLEEWVLVALAATVFTAEECRQPANRRTVRLIDPEVTVPLSRMARMWLGCPKGRMEVVDFADRGLVCPLWCSKRCDLLIFLGSSVVMGGARPLCRPDWLRMFL